MRKRTALLIMLVIITIPVTFWETWFALEGTPPKLQIQAYIYTLFGMLSTAAAVLLLRQYAKKRRQYDMSVYQRQEQPAMHRPHAGHNSEVEAALERHLRRELEQCPRCGETMDCSELERHDMVGCAPRAGRVVDMKV